MKKHLCGFFIALTTFFVSFYISPIRFTDDGSGHGATADLLYQCSFSRYASNHFSTGFRWICNYEKPETANEIFKREVGNAIEIVEPINEIEFENGKKIRRAIIKPYPQVSEFYRLVRTDGNSVHEIESTSLRYVKEFEAQKFKD